MRASRVLEVVAECEEAAGGDFALAVGFCTSSKIFLMYQQYQLCWFLSALHILPPIHTLLICFM